MSSNIDKEEDAGNSGIDAALIDAELSGAAVILKSGLYRRDGEILYKILPETTADQVKLANGQTTAQALSVIDTLSDPDRVIFARMVRVGAANPRAELCSDSVRLFDAAGVQVGGLYISQGEGWTSTYIRSLCPSDAGSKVALFSIVVNSQGQGYPSFTGVASPASPPNTALALVGYVNSRAAAAANEMTGGEAFRILQTLEESARSGPDELSPDQDDPDPAASGEEPSLPLVKARYIQALNDEARRAIFGGFPFEYGGQAYVAPTSLYDQQNLTDLAIIAGLRPDQPIDFSCQDAEGSWAKPAMTGQDFLAVFEAWTTYRRDILEDARRGKALVAGAATAAEAKNAYMARTTFSRARGQ